MGMPCDLAAIVKLARARNLLVIEDAACAIGSEILWNGQWEKIGKPHGDIACFSFHPRKIMSTGDGGMITTNNQEWDAQVPPAAPARHERAGHRAPRLGEGDLRVVPDRRLQLPHDGHPGRGRPRTAQAPARDRRAPPRDRRPLSRVADADIPGIALPTRAGHCAQQLAELLRAPARPCSTSAQSCRRCSTQGVSTRRGIMCSHREAPYLQRQPLRRAAALRGRAGPLHGAAAVSAR